MSYSSGSQILQLAVLHPSSVGVYSLISRSGVTDHGTQNNLLLVYEHSLKRSTSNLIVAPFGGSQSRDFICVQSLDGLLTFFEQESFSFCCFLPEFLLPAPIVYVQSVDSFVTCNSNWCITSFSYKRLSEIGQNSKQTDTDGVKFGADWSYNLGEDILDIRVIDKDANEIFIVVLGERNLFCLSDTGKLKFMKRFDFTPHCLHCYYLKETNKLMTLVVTEVSTLLLYDNTTLRWSAQLSMLPVGLGRGTFAYLSGALVLLSEQGALQFCYLGTEPQLFAAPPLQNQELDLEKAEEELALLYKKIKANDPLLTNAAAERELQVTVNVNPHLEPCLDEYIATENAQMCIVTIELLPNSLFEEAQILLVVEEPLYAHPKMHFVSNLSDRTKFESHVCLGNVYEIPSLEMKIVVSHITNAGLPRVLEKSVQLPLKLVMESAPPSKDSAHKVTININKHAAPLSALFPEYAGENSLSLSSNAIGFQNIAKTVLVTILLAKSSERYRLHSDSIASLSLFSEQLIQRLKKHFENESEFVITYDSTLPVGPFLDCIERHFLKRDLVIKLQGELSELSTQFRLIQKRLIIKFKDKNPTPLNNLDILMFETYSEIMECSDRLQFETEELKKLQCELSGVIKLMMILIEYSSVSEELFKKVYSVFITPVCDIEEQNWEDVIDGCITYFLRTILFKSDKDQLKNTSNTLDQVKDIYKFKKRLSQFFDRLLKSTNIETQLEEIGKIVEQTNDNLQQIGNEIALSSVRAQSAKLTKSKLLLTTTEEVENEAL